MFRKKKVKEFNGMQESQTIVSSVIKLHVLYPIKMSRENAKEWYQFCKHLESMITLWKKQAREKINEKSDD